MLLIYITGDTHIPIDIKKLNTKNFPEQRQMTKGDYVIVCGDFGGVWDNSKEDRYWLGWLDGRNFTTLFVDGNHENHSMLNQHRVKDYRGGKIHVVSESIYHLMRGEIFNICGVKIFDMGGAESHDKRSRKEGVSWWPEEMPSDEEYQNAIDNLTKNDWKVDVVVTHCCPDSIQSDISKYYSHNKLTNFFEHVIKDKCKYDKWFFGHYHEDGVFEDKHICLYNKIIAL